MTKNDLSLYGITEELNALEEILMDEGGEITEASEELVEQANQLIESKVDGVVGFIKKQNDLIAIAKERKKEMDAFIKKKNNQIQRFNDYVKMCLEKSGKKEFTGTLNVIKLRKPSKILEIVDEALVPFEFKKSVTTESIDKAELKKTIKNIVSLSIPEILENSAKEAKELGIDDVLAGLCLPGLEDNITKDLIIKTMLGVQLVDGKTSVNYSEVK